MNSIYYLNGDSVNKRLSLLTFSSDSNLFNLIKKILYGGEQHLFRVLGDVDYKITVSYIDLYYDTKLNVYSNRDRFNESIINLVYCRDNTIKMRSNFRFINVTSVQVTSVHSSINFYAFLINLLVKSSFDSADIRSYLNDTQYIFDPVKMEMFLAGVAECTENPK